MMWYPHSIFCLTCQPSPFPNKLLSTVQDGVQMSELHPLNCHYSLYWENVNWIPPCQPTQMHIMRLTPKWHWQQALAESVRPTQALEALLLPSMLLPGLKQEMERSPWLWLEWRLISVSIARRSERWGRAGLPTHPNCRFLVSHSCWWATWKAKHATVSGKDFPMHRRFSRHKHTPRMCMGLV